MSPTVEPGTCPTCGQERLTITEVVRRPGSGVQVSAVVKVICGCSQS